MKLEVSQFSEKLYEVEISHLDLINGAEIFIGRADDCHIVLEDQQVSRRHALLTYKEGSLHLKRLSDLGNVTVNGNEVANFVLSEGDKFKITDFSLRVAGLPESDNLIERNITTISKLDEFDDGPTDEATEILSGLEDPLEIEPIEEQTPEETPLEEDYSNDEDESEFSVNDEFAETDNENSEEGFEQDDDSFATDAFGDDAFGDDDMGGGFEGSSGDSTAVFNNFAKYYLEIDGEKAPFDKYQIEDNEIFIGRDKDKCQIHLDDPEVSMVHAIIKKTLINCYIEDQGSSNGTIFNGERINKAELTNNDNFQIGSTIFTVKITSDLIESEKDTLMPVEDGQEVEVEEYIEEEVDFDALTPQDSEYALQETEEKSIIKKIMKDPRKRIYAIVAILVLMVLLIDDEPSSPSVSKEENTKAVASDQKKPEEAAKKQISEETIAKLEENYVLALAKYEAGEYYQAKEYVDIIRSIDPEYKNTPSLHNLIQEGIEELLRLKAEEEAEKERKKRQLKIDNLLKKIRDAITNKEILVAESLIGQVLEMDPENMDVQQLKLEVDAYKEEQRRIEEEEARKRALRQAMVDALAPGKTAFLKEEWYEAIDKLEKFTNKKGMDEDLIKEATDMLSQAKEKLSEQIDPLIGRARSFKEGQDLKRAYETYGEVLRFDPSNEEAITEREKIFDTLRTRSMKVYREALISESLSLFDEAKEKFEEVQQISPINSEYYIKATERLKDYLE